MIVHRRPGNLFSAYLLGCLALWATVPAWSDGSATRNISVAQLSNSTHFVVLNRKHPTFRFQWVIPPVEETKDATLAVQYFAGPNTPTGTELIVSLNGKDVGAVREHRNYPQGEFTVALAAGILHAGPQVVTIRLRPPSRVGAQRPSAWTQIDAYQSILRYQSAIERQAHLSFADVKAILQESDSMISLPLILRGPVNSTMLQAAQAAVAGVALWVHQPVAVQVEEGHLSSQEKVAPLVLMLGQRSVFHNLSKVGRHGPELLLRHSGKDTREEQLILTGDNPSQILAAARAFAQNRQDLPLCYVPQ